MDETGHDGDPAGDAGDAGEASGDPAARRHSHAGTRVHDRESEILPAAADREQAEGSGAAGLSGSLRRTICFVPSAVVRAMLLRPSALSNALDI